MVHLDLRPANIFIKLNTESIHLPFVNSKPLSELLAKEVYLLKLGDLGHCCLIDETSWTEGESRLELGLGLELQLGLELELAVGLVLEI
jgi:serine/threonine protein kinase